MPSQHEMMVYCCRELVRQQYDTAINNISEVRFHAVAAGAFLGLIPLVLEKSTAGIFWFALFGYIYGWFMTRKDRKRALDQYEKMTSWLEFDP